MENIHKYVVDGYVGVADLNNTFGHISLKQEAEKHGFKPIYGVRLHVAPDDSKFRTCQVSYIFIAKNDDGLKEIYSLVAKAYEQFHYYPKLFEIDLQDVTDNVFIIAPFYNRGLRGKIDAIAVGQGYGTHFPAGIGMVAIDQNNYGEMEDKHVYELLAGARKNGDSYAYFFTEQTYPQHVLNEKEWDFNYPGYDKAMDATYSIAERCDADIQKADMVKWNGEKNSLAYYMNPEKITLLNKPEYHKRYDYELSLIREKGYGDYFLIVADMIKQAKKTMLVGPARGSSAGSLICYLMDITEVDPIEHNLIFERFIDINRLDLPDIDIDFPDTKRGDVIEALKDKYGRDRVMCLANVNRLKARSAIGEFAKGLGIPAYETSGVKDALVERSAGDSRANKCIADTFKTVEQGQLFIDNHPKMALAERIEGHASHAGKHAAGILVSTLPLCNYGSLDVRSEIIQLDKRDAEYLGLLKIDCLGLRNLSILEGVCVQIGVDYDFFYKLPLDDAKTYELFNSMRLSGIFQFEGDSLKQIVKQMGVRNFGDISAITALARPGSLSSGGTARFIRYVTGDEAPTYYSDTYRSITESTFGIIVYQEQMMEVARQIGNLSWEDVSHLRKATSKSMGDEYINKFKDKFEKGALENGYPSLDIETIWDDIVASGSYSFNKSHAVSYGLVSYWTAWCKANHPLEFAVACLNNTADDENARKLLRDMVTNEGIDYVAVDINFSEENWSTHEGKLIGGLLNIKGIGKVKARQIIKSRKGFTNFMEQLPKGILKTMNNPVTPFDIIFPAAHYWDFLYNDPKSHGLHEKPMFISDVNDRGDFVFIGCLLEKTVKDLNSQEFVKKRDGETVSGNSLYLNFKVYDDTDSIPCRIDRFHYKEIGGMIEDGREDKDWFLLRGKIKSDWRNVNITEIIHLNSYFKVTIS